MINRICPICESNNFSLIRNIEFVLYEKHPMADGYELVQCKNCSFIYANTKVTQNQLDKYYSDLSKYEDKKISTGGGYNQFDKDRLIKTAKYIASKFADKKISIVDIGCAIGGMLEQLRNLGFNDITGIDPSISCVEITRNDKNIKCHHASIFDIDESFGKYDLIIISHVWEHILDLKLAIKHLESILKNDGFIYVECPNAMNYKNIVHTPLQEFNTEHINHFYLTAFNNFFGIQNYELIDSGLKTMKLASNEDYDVLYAIYRKSHKNLNYKIVFDDDILNAINEYIFKSDKQYIDILLRIKSVMETNTSIALFGIGQFAFKLLKSISKLEFGNKIFLFDNNSHSIGKKLDDGNMILHGDSMIELYKEEKFNIIVTSLIYQKEIIESIKNKFVSNELSIPAICNLK